MIDILIETLGLSMFAVACIVLMLGFPVAFSLAGVALIFAGIGISLDVFRPALLNALPSRYFGIMTNEILVAVPLFVFMGIMLERSRIAEALLMTMGRCFGRLRGGLGLSVVFVGMLLAASTGIVGATVVTMGLMSLPVMIRSGYDPKLATGIICASGTLGQIIPPSIVLILLGDILQGANTQAQLAQGNYAPDTISVMDLFAGAVVPGIMLVCFYMLWIVIRGFLTPDDVPIHVSGTDDEGIMNEVLRSLLPPAILIFSVLGAILFGVATPTEGASIGAIGAVILAVFKRQITKEMLQEVMQETLKISSMIFVILLGASVFSLVFRGLGGDELVEELLKSIPGGAFGAMLSVMVLMFIMGFFLDFIEIIFVVVPIVGPVLLQMDIDPVWFGIMIAINLQTSFLTPPFGFALFYLRGVAPDEVKTSDIYKGVIPFVIIQLLMLCLLAMYPSLITALPHYLF